MIKEILSALESNKFITITFARNGENIQVVASARSDKGGVTPPVNLLVDPDSLEESLAKLFDNLWIKGRKENRKKAASVSEPEKTDSEETTIPETDKEISAAIPDEKKQEKTKTEENATPEADEETFAAIPESSETDDDDYEEF